MQKLDFLLIGAQKCATTWLHGCLRDHPELHLPAKKREVEYLGGDLFEKQGADWYFSLLAGATAGQKVGDASVDYLFDPRAPAVVQTYAPDVKLIVSLRNPLDRLISAYYWSVRKGMIPDLPLEEGLERALAQRTSQVQARDSFYDALFERGYYDQQLNRYLQHFPAEQLLVVLYEDIAARPQAALERIYRFLAVDAAFVPAAFESRPKQNTYFKPLISLERLAPQSRVVNKLADLTNQGLSRLGFAAAPPQVSASLQAALTAHFAPHVAQTQKLIQDAPPSQRPLSANLLRTWRYS